MLQPYSFRSSQLVTSPIPKTQLPTGKSFGGSKLSLRPLQELVLPLAIDVESIADNHPRSTAEPQPASLAIEVGKIVAVTLWFWCLLGANFCCDRISSIANVGTPDV
jgi:hypothetical protein